MQESESMCLKILKDIETVIAGDELLKEFCIVTVMENEKNKSPVLHIDHNLGLESWCVKHIYRYAYDHLFEARKLLRNGKLPPCKTESLNRLLIGALLINPDVCTFWNLKRELVQRNILEVKKELFFTKIILTYKSKSNETFAYRRWCINKENLAIPFGFLNRELEVSEMAAQRAQNNYHAWNHRIWALQTLASEYYNLILNTQLDFSLNWICSHVSEHAGFHYRQFILKLVKKNSLDKTAIEKYKKVLLDLIGCGDGYDIDSLLHRLFGDLPRFYNKAEHAKKQKQFFDYVCVLFHELHDVLKRLNQLYSCNESVWYHRRFVCDSIIKAIYDYNGIDFQTSQNIDAGYVKNESENIIDCNLDISTITQLKFQENGEIFPKLFKYNKNVIQSTELFRIFVKMERNFILENNRSKRSDSVSLELNRRHKNWLNFILEIEI